MATKSPRTVKTETDQEFRAYQTIFPHEMDEFKECLESAKNYPIFEAAARTLTFTKAAEELFITQSAVSRQIKALRTISALSCLSDGRGHSR